MMNFDLSLFFTALGLAFILESLPWILSPNSMRNFLLSLAGMPEGQLRIMGLVLMSLGLLLIWLVRGA